MKRNEKVMIHLEDLPPVDSQEGKMALEISMLTLTLKNFSVAYSEIATSHSANGAPVIATLPNPFSDLTRLVKLLLTYPSRM